MMHLDKIKHLRSKTVAFRIMESSNVKELNTLVNEALSYKPKAEKGVEYTCHLYGTPFILNGKCCQTIIWEKYWYEFEEKRSSNSVRLSSEFNPVDD